jgi:serine/threonine protein kinase
MDKYHIYEEIGKGNFSQVYKGREKKRIEYVAIKRVEKSMMNKVVNEVQVMHKLDSPHMLKFHDWYETRNNLWLILEYCTGSDLDSLLRQDGHLPEESVRNLGLDMLAGLKYMHGMGLLHCDLRPCNFLVDEYGILKLCDFKLARRIPKSALGPLEGPGAVPLEQRGTPPYMSPELWREDGVHSFASDFWALGCVLYELRRGQQPYGDEDTELRQLLDNIQCIEPVYEPLPPYKAERSPSADNATSGYSSRGPPQVAQRTGRAPKSPGVAAGADSGPLPLPSMSAELGDLLCWLLEKQPQNRCDWESVSVHQFWGHKSNPVPQGLPEQDAFRALTRLYETEHETALASMLVKDCGLSDLQARDVVSHRKDLPGSPHQPANAPGSATKHPLQPLTSDSTPMRPSAKADTASASGAGAGSERRVGSIPEESKADAKDDQVQQSTPVYSRTIESKDLPPSQFATPVVNRVAPGASSSAAAAANTDGAKVPTHVFNAATMVTTPHATEAHALLEGSFFGADEDAPEDSRHMPSPPVRDRDRADGHKAVDAFPSTARGAEKGASQVTPGIFGEPSPVTITATSDAPRGTTDADGQGGLWPADMTAESLLLHAQDTQVKPVVGNKYIEAIEKYAVKAQSVPFDVLSVEEVQDMQTEALEQHLTAVYKAMQRATTDAAGAMVRGGSAAGSTMCADRIQMLAYLISIGSVAEVANIVLNTNFLGALLKLIKGPPVSTAPGDARAGTGSRGSSRESARAPIVTPAMTSLRSMAATTLATMLRYATFVAPPSAKTRDDHLLSVLTGILRSEYASSGPTAGAAPAAFAAGKERDSGSRLDPKLKRRVIAALGETLFYISSQEDGADGEDQPWALPPATIFCLVRCLKDDTDEIVRHYAAKTIENILAQGGKEHKRRLVSADVAARLLDMSQHGRNDALQATCAMALAHMFAFVMSSESPSSAELPSPVRGTSARGARTLNKASSPSADAASSSASPGAGARFIVKVLDRGGLPAILETLNDGQPKVQQAYLNILNLIFCLPAELALATNDPDKQDTAISPKTARAFIRTGNSAPGAAELRSTRQFFLKNATFVPAILKLIETGATGAVRAKALLTAQLVCDHQPSLLVQFSERRLPSVLLRLVEPLVLATSGAAGQAVRSSLQRAGSGPLGAEPNAVPKGSAAYPMHAALSFITFVKTACTAGSAELQLHCSRIAMVDGDSTFGGTYGGGPSAGSPTKRRPGSPSSGIRSSPSPNGGSTMRSTPASSRKGVGVDGTPGGKEGRLASRSTAVAPDLARVHALAELVRAAVTVAALPSLRRLILADGPELVIALTKALAELPRARLGLATLPAGDPFVVEATLALQAADQALLAVLEGVVAVDSADLVEGMGAHTGAADKGKRDSTVSPSEVGSFAEALVLLLPAVAGLTSHPDGDVRVVIASALRRLMPGALRALLQTARTAKERSLLQARCVQCIRSPCGSALAVLLGDQAPIPQYAVRMLVESLQITAELSDLIARQLGEGGGLSALVALFGRQAERVTEWGQEQDPQLTVLLRLLFERRGLELPLLQAGMPHALCGVLFRMVQQQQQLEERGGGLTQSHRLNYLSAVAPQVELLHVALHFVIRRLSGGDDKDGTALQACERVQECRTLYPVLLSALITAVLELAPSDAVAGAGHVDKTADSASLHTADTVSRCLGILFDLFPDSVTEYLCNGSTAKVALEPAMHQYYVSLRVKGRDISPREVLAAVICQPSAHIRLRSRILKIIAGMLSIAPQIGKLAIVREAALSSQLYGALRACTKASKDSKDADLLAFSNLARNVLTAVAEK